MSLREPNEVLAGRDIIKKRTYHQMFSSVTQSCLTLCDPRDCSAPGLPVHHELPGLAQTHVHQIGDAIQPSLLLLSPSLPAFSLFQHQSLFQWVSCPHQAAKVLELQLQDQVRQWLIIYTCFPINSLFPYFYKWNNGPPSGWSQNIGAILIPPLPCL